MSDTMGRLSSLDAFRGFTIAAMVLVNNPGDWGNLYSQLAHCQVARPVPGIGAGVLEPGKDFGAWIDRMVLGSHLWVQSLDLGSGRAGIDAAGAVQPAAGRAGGPLAAVKL
jgi:hypothetical protein